MAKFEKGNPGGPGRPKGSGHLEQCQEWADEKGLPFLQRVVEGTEPGSEEDLSLRVDTARYLVDRGFGRPAQAHIDLTANGGMTLEEIIAGSWSAELPPSMTRAVESLPAPISEPKPQAPI